MKNPHVTRVSDEKGVIEAKALLHIISGKSPAIIHGVPEAEKDENNVESVFNYSRASLGSNKAVFFVSDRTRFCGIIFPYHLIILNKQEYEAVQKKYSPMYAYQFHFSIVDRDGTRAFIIWSAEWYGGSLWLEKKQDGWHLAKSESWVS